MRLTLLTEIMYYHFCSSTTSYQIEPCLTDTSVLSKTTFAPRLIRTTSIVIGNRNSYNDTLLADTEFYL